MKSVDSDKSLNTNHKETVNIVKNLIRVDVPKVEEFDTL
jgi:hypothetical protein